MVNPYAQGMYAGGYSPAQPQLGMYGQYGMQYMNQPQIYMQPQVI
jgi:hypothetical protein